MTPLFGTVVQCEFSDGRFHFRNSGLKGLMFVYCFSADTDTEEQVDEDQSDRYVQTKISVIVSPYLYVSEEL